MNESIKLTLDHHLTWWGWFPISLPCRPFLGWYISSLLFISLATCETDAYLIPSAHSLLLRKYIAHPALHELPGIILSFYHLLEKLHLSSAPPPWERHPSTQTCFSPRCPSILVPLIKPHRVLFIKIMPGKPWILSEEHIQQNAKEVQRLMWKALKECAN